VEGINDIIKYSDLARARSAMSTIEKHQRRAAFLWLRARLYSPRRGGWGNSAEVFSAGNSQRIITPDFRIKSNGGYYETGNRDI